MNTFRTLLACVLAISLAGCDDKGRHNLMCAIAIDVNTCKARPGCSCEPVADPNSCDLEEVCGLRDDEEPQSVPEPVQPGGAVG